MTSRLKKTLILMPIFIVLALVISSAEVKLRIYLKDGTLRSGNLVKDTENKFVILTQSGRMEIPKKEIMFVNGKTLEQWQDRPDKFFQTEIIPDELPKPGYVNAKAALESAPKPNVPVEPLAPLAEVMNKQPQPEVVEEYEEYEEEEYEEVPIEEVLAEEPADSQQTASAFPMSGPMALPVQEPVQQVPPAKTQPVSTKPKVAKVSPVPVKKKKTVAQKKAKPKVQTAKISKKSKPVKRVQASVEKPIVISVKKPRRYSRKRYADYHYKRAKAYMKKGAVGRAKQELHYATTLDRRNSDSALLLGKLYFESGVFSRSKKLFKHPELKNRIEVSEMLTEMERTVESRKKERNVFYASASAGLLTMVPLMMLARKMRKSSKPSQVIDAESISLLETTGEPVDVPEPPPAPPAPSEKITPRVEKPVPPPTPTIPEPPQETAVPEPEAPKQVPPAPQVFPFPETVVPPVSQGPSFVSKPPEPTKPPPAEFFPQAQKPAPEPPAEFFEKPQPVVEPTEAAPLSPEEEHAAILKLSQQVDEVITLGHSYAADGKLDLANREYRTAIALNPACLEGYLGLGFLYFMNNQWELALANYVKALEIDPNCADAHYGIGRVLLETGGEDQAVPEFEKTLQIDPTFEDARESLTALGKLS